MGGKVIWPENQVSETAPPFLSRVLMYKVDMHFVRPIHSGSEYVFNAKAAVFAGGVCGGGRRDHHGDDQVASGERVGETSGFELASPAIRFLAFVCVWRV